MNLTTEQINIIERLGQYGISKESMIALLNIKI